MSRTDFVLIIRCEASLLDELDRLALSQRRTKAQEIVFQLSEAAKDWQPIPIGRAPHHTLERRYTARLPVHLHEKLKNRAHELRVSVNTLIISVLSKAVKSMHSDERGAEEIETARLALDVAKPKPARGLSAKCPGPFVSVISVCAVHYAAWALCVNYLDHEASMPVLPAGFADALQHLLETLGVSSHDAGQSAPTCRKEETL